jgi:hypothetical protein
MECEPSVSDEIVSVATPPPANVALPSAAAPSLNVTVPVGVPPPLVTVAVKVTAWPIWLGLSEEISDVAVTPLEIVPLTICVAICGAGLLSVTLIV